MYNYVKALNTDIVFNVLYIYFLFYIMYYIHIVKRFRAHCGFYAIEKNYYYYTYQELREYKETVREHPFERLWVDCLIKPSLLALRLLHAHRDGDFLLQKASSRR